MEKTALTLEHKKQQAEDLNQYTWLQNAGRCHIKHISFRNQHHPILDQTSFIHYYGEENQMCWLFFLVLVLENQLKWFFFLFSLKSKLCQRVSCVLLFCWKTKDFYVPLSWFISPLFLPAKGHAQRGMANKEAAGFSLCFVLSSKQTL